MSAGPRSGGGRWEAVAVGEPLWEPDSKQRAESHLATFIRLVEAREKVVVGEYEDLHRFSVDRLDRFWRLVWEAFGVIANKCAEESVGEETMPGARWFGGALLNYAENVLERPFRATLPPPGIPPGWWGVRPPQAEALHHRSELRGLERLTFSELRGQVAALGAGLRELGVGPGDRVCAYLPNIAETVVAFLASAAVGAIWSSAPPEFGPQAVSDRFAQIEPKVLFAVDGYRYAGRDHDRRPALAEILRNLPTVEHLITLPYLVPDRGPDAFPPGPYRRALSFAELELLGEGAKPSYVPLPFDHPLWVLYSSGTTGLPKAIVHSHGGILLEQLKKAYLHLDLKGEDRMFWFSTTGWMMWNFLVGCLLGEGLIVLYDGAPLAPRTDALWRFAEEAGITCFGTSAAFLAQTMKEDLGGGGSPGDRFDLGSLRAIGATGSPLAPEVFAWVYGRLKEDLWLYSTSGGTDVCTAFVGGCPLREVRAGELQCKALGAAVECFDEAGRPLVEAVGELVVTKPLPSMPVFLWGDRDGSRYREAYFSVYPGVWRHGDWIRLTKRGTAVIYGRSDATINRGGVRIGTAELYRAVDSLPEVRESLVVDLPQSSALGAPLELVLFVVLAPGCALDEHLVRKITQAVVERCSPRHRPDRVLAVPALPRTLSGKLLELPVKRILCGEPQAAVVNPEALADPQALADLLEAARAAGLQGRRERLEGE